MNGLISILLLLGGIAFVLWRLPRVDLGHSDAYKRRRFFNWFPLGLTYAFLYMGRYNLSAIVDLLDKQGVLTKKDFGIIDGWGSAVYGIAFLLNGPLTDLWGGRRTILIAAIGTAVMNLATAVAMSMALGGELPDKATLILALTVLFSLNMYFQSFGAVSIVKVNAPWFHVRERGVLGGVFGILISLGLYFAYDWCRAIAQTFGYVAAFWVPAVILLAFALIDFLVVRDSPVDAGHRDFDTGDAVNEDGENPTLKKIVTRLFSQRVIWIIVAIEFCSGFLRQAVMKWYRTFATSIGDTHSFVYENWGLLLCLAGIIGAVIAGFISDHVFESRRGPVATVLYAGLLAGAVLAAITLETPVLGWAVVFMSFCVIGVHGMLAGTASADFGGRKNAGIVTGIIDGFVYLGTSTQAFVFGAILPQGDDAKLVGNWLRWPLTMIPVAVVGLLLATRVWNARPRGSAAAH